MLSLLREPWPWYVAGPLIGLFVPLLLLIGNKSFGVSGSLRAICAAVAPGDLPFFRYDWRRTGIWSIAFAVGLLLGGFLAATLLGSGAPAIAPPSPAPPAAGARASGGARGTRRS